MTNQLDPKPVKETQAYKYAKECVKKTNKNVPKYVKLQCQEFIDIANGKNKKYQFNEKRIARIEYLLELLVMPKGLKAGKSMLKCLTSYQWLFILATLCIVYRDNPKKRRYETAILEISRKNFKTYTIAILFIILFLTEPKFSKMYSVSATGQLSREIKSALEETLKASPEIYYLNGNDSADFRMLRDFVEFKPKESKYIPLNYSTSTMDGKLPNVFLADEVGALPNSYPIEAMRSGQLNILNKLGFVISTKYPTIDNPFEDEVKYAKQVLDGIEKDETVFALLYEPDEEVSKNWMTNDLVLKQANPVSLEIPEIWEDLLKKRQRAIAMESTRENFLTKHCNIIYQGRGTETYIDVNDVIKNRVVNIDWEGRDCWIGVDLSESNDNTAVVMLGIDDDQNLLVQPMGFIPEDRIVEKTISEKFDYEMAIEKGEIIACGQKTIDYSIVEEYVIGLADKYKVNIIGIGYDRWNCYSSAQKWQNNGLNTYEVKQHSNTLHPATKLLYEKMVNGEVKYVENKVFEVNFQNAKCTYDSNMNKWVHKKKSSGKVDEVVALITATHLLMQDVLLNQSNFVSQAL